jgi:hypothetical protein
VQRVVDALRTHPIDNSEQGKNLSFKLALPGLGCAEDIKAFIGHVAQGIALGIFTGREGSQLLYAAQVALAALHSERPASLERMKSGWKEHKPKRTKKAVAGFYNGITGESNLEPGD